MKCQREQLLIIQWTLSPISAPLFIAKHLRHQSHTKTQSQITTHTTRMTTITQYLTKHQATTITHHQLQHQHLNTNQSQHILKH